MVYAADAETLEVSTKQVLETYIRETSSLVHLTINGENIIHPAATSQLEETLREEENLPHVKNALTPRERDVLAELTKGKSNREIASSLFVTEKTVKTHISNIFTKLEVQDRTQAALYAVKHGLTEGSEQSI